MNVFGRLNALKSSAYAGLMSTEVVVAVAKSDAVRGEDRTGLHDGVEEVTRKGVDVVCAAGTASHLISRRPSGSGPGVPPFSRIAEHCAELGQRRGDIAGRGEDPEVGPTHRRRHRGAVRCKRRGVPVPGAGRVGAAVIVARSSSQCQYQLKPAPSRPPDLPAMTPSCCKESRRDKRVSPALRSDSCIKACARSRPRPDTPRCLDATRNER